MAKKSNKIVNYFKEVKSELKKVVWPSFKQVKNNTLIVIICVLVIGAFIWLCDAIFAETIGRVVDKMQGETAVEETTDKPADDAAQQEVSLEDQIQFYKNYGVDYDGTTFKNAEGEEITQEQAVEIVTKAMEAEQAAAAENTDAQATEDAEGTEPAEDAAEGENADAE